MTRNSLQKFDWLVTECAPRGFPVRVIRGGLLFDDGRSVHIPARRVVNNGWGAYGSIHIAGDALKPVPVGLACAWLSYTENCFYRAEVALPADTMLSLFQNGLVNPRNHKHATYDRIIVGMAPGGHVSVWLGAERVVTEIATYNASVIEIPWAGILENREVSREAHVESVLKQTQAYESQRALGQHPELLGKWPHYSRRWSWTPRTEPNSSIHGVWIYAWNGESEWVDFTAPTRSSGTMNSVVSRAVPRMLVPHWTHTSGLAMTTEMRLDEVEVFAQFEELLADPLHTSLAVMIETDGVSLAAERSDSQAPPVRRMKRVRVDLSGHPRGTW